MKKMKNYVVGICSLFDNEVKLFKVVAENDYCAVNKAFVELAPDEESKQSEIDWQNHPDYPKSLEDLIIFCEGLAFSVIEVTKF